MPYYLFWKYVPGTNRMRKTSNPKKLMFNNQYHLEKVLQQLKKWPLQCPEDYDFSFDLKHTFTECTVAYASYAQKTATMRRPLDRRNTCDGSYVKTVDLTDQLQTQS